MKTVKELTFLIVIGILSLNTNAQSFSKSQVYDSLTLTSIAINTPNRAALFDYDQDGDDDIFYYGGLNDSRVIVFQNNNGSFDDASVFYDSGSNDRIIDMTLIDFDSDGDLDIVANIGLNSQGDILKFENLGNGNFDLTVQQNVLTMRNYISSADMDNDGLPDLIYDTYNPNEVRWVKNLGNGNFANTYSVIATNGGYFELADMDNDGDIDLIISSGNEDIYLNDGNGNFNSTIDLPSNEFNSYYTLGDFNADGLIDIAHSKKGTYNTDGEINILWNDVNTNFTSSLIKSYPPGVGALPSTFPFSIESFDFDGDGNLDLLVGELTGGDGKAEGAVLINDGSGNFNEHTDKINGTKWKYNFGKAEIEMFFSDIDADGNMDILTSSFGDNDLILHKQNSAGNFSQGTYINHSFHQIQNFQILDYNNDGYNDLVTVDENINGKLEVAYGNGANNFDSSQVIIDNRTPDGVSGGPQLAFWNNNSDYDLIYSSNSKVFVHLDYNTANDSVVLLFTTTAGSGSNGRIGYNNIRTKVFTVADIDNDGDNDLIIPQKLGENYYWIENTGGSNFVEHIIPSSVFDRYEIVDVDDDGDLDFVGQKYNSSTSLTDYTFYEMNSFTKEYTSYLTLSTTTPSAAIRHQFAAGDIDGDGDEDIVISGLMWMENNGAGNFSAPVDLITGYNTEQLILIEDINNDGLLDIITNVNEFNPSKRLVVPLFNQGNNVFTPLGQELEVLGSSAWVFEVGDFNGDGFKSIVASSDELGLVQTPILFNFCEIAENTVEVDVCSGGSYTLADGTELTNISQNDTYVSTLSGQAANGCDSIVTENINVLSASSGTDILTACNSYIWIDGNTYTSNNNTATHTLTNAAGCDSVVTLDLTINNSTSGTDQITACDSYTWIDGNTYTSSNTTAMHTLTNAAGCDSIVTLDLTINSVDNGVTITNDTELNADQTGADYQWLACDNNFAPISGETNQQFVVLSTGNYAVEVTINNCSDTSDCIVIDNLKIGDQSPLSEIAVYPNPTDGKVNIDLGALQDVTIELSTIEGKVVSREEATQSLHMIDIKAPKGLFIIKVSYGGNAKHFKVVKM